MDTHCRLERFRRWCKMRRVVRDTRMGNLVGLAGL